MVHSKHQFAECLIWSATTSRPARHTGTSMHRAPRHCLQNATSCPNTHDWWLDTLCYLVHSMWVLWYRSLVSIYVIVSIVSTQNRSGSRGWPKDWAIFTAWFNMNQPKFLYENHRNVRWLLLVKSTQILTGWMVSFWVVTVCWFILVFSMYCASLLSVFWLTFAVLSI